MNADDTPARAQAWLAEPAAQTVPAHSDERVALGRALKEAGYEALHADLSRCKAAERALNALHEAETEPAARALLQALACSMRGALSVVEGDCARAIEALDQAHDGFSALGLLQDAAAARVPKVAALSMLARHDEALACAQQALAVFAAVGDKRSAGKVEINLGSMLLHQDRYEEAALHYRRAAARFAQVDDRRHSVMADIGLAGALGWQFEFDEALRIYDRAQARIRAHDLTGLEGVVASSRGLLELRRGRHAQALHWLEAALRAAEQLGQPQRLADARAELAEAYLALNLLPEAAALFEQAIEGCRATDAAVEEAWATAHLGFTRARLGEDDAALALLQRAGGLFDGQDNRVGAAWLAVQAAALGLRRGDAAARWIDGVDAAAAALREAGMRRWGLDAELVAAQALAAIAARRTEAWSRLEALERQAVDVPEVLAETLLAQGRWQCMRGDRAGARDRFDAAARATEAQQAGLHGDEFRVAYGSERQAAFDALIEMAIDDGEPVALLNATERARARSYALARQRGDAVAGAAAEREPLHWLEQQWQQAVAGGDLARAGLLKQRIAALEARVLEASRRAQAAAAPQAAAAGSAPWAIDPSELRGALADDQALVDYAWVGERLAAVVARRGRIVSVPLDGRDVVARVEQLRFQINSLRFGAPALRRHAAQMAQRAQAHLQALHRDIWAPLAGALEGAARIIVLPQRALHYVPFCALHDGRAALLESLAFTLAPSVRAWLDGRASRPAHAPRRVLAMGVGGQALPHVRSEVEAVARTFGSSTAWLDDDATLARLRAGLPEADLLHLACHGEFRADSPFFSAIQLGDGRLTLRDAAALPLRGKWVTLSACETGVSRIAPGDETLGLVRGFLMAGAPTVLATQWTVDDAGTARLMADYGVALKAGREPALALREAQLALRQAQAHPYFWAPFTLHGQG